jgi:mannose-1-phosphate guanylyltransferase/mannose-6-phosphate isomerase
MEKFCINISQSIKQAIYQLEYNKKQFVVCINNEQVYGTLTDGDIRRALLNGYTLQDSIEKIYNKDYKCLTLDSTFDEVCEIFKSNKINFLPIVDQNKKLINIITKKQFHIMLLDNIPFDLKYDFFSLNEDKLEYEIYNRPWGFYKSTILTSHAQAKIITIFPQGELSLQEHKKREEHWIIIKGNGKMILGESELDIYPGRYIYIPKGCKHQIINTSNKNLIFSEVQLGNYFGEDDIIRYSDKYGRVKNNKKG